VRITEIKITTAKGSFTKAKNLFPNVVFINVTTVNDVNSDIINNHLPGTLFKNSSLVRIEKVTIISERTDSKNHAAIRIKIKA